MTTMTIEEKAKAYDEKLVRAKEQLDAASSIEYKDEQISHDIRETVYAIFPELKESEDEIVRKEITGFFKNYRENGTYLAIPDVTKWIAWLEKQGDTNETINRDEFAQGVLRGAAINLITWIDYNAAEGNMCLSNMECEDIENSLVSGNWDKIYAYIKKKLEKQGEQKSYWKPTKEQYEALDYAYNSCSDTERGNYYEGVLETLIEDLHRLEKQGEKEHKVEPKFKHGDRVRNKKTGKETIVSEIYEYVYNGIIPFFIKDQDDWELVEQKPADKIEPKFKVGDWITNGKCTWKIDSIDEDMYYNNHCGIECGGDIKSIDEEYHLWTIQDAKDGDVLCCENGWTCIFKALDNHKNTYSSYCFMDSDKWFCNAGSECHTLNEQFIKAYNSELHPATKEQRDLLFQKMKEAGYEWDAEKKELKKIESRQEKLTEFEKAVKQVMEEAIECGDTHNLKADADMLQRLVQKPAWSEEDEEMLRRCISATFGHGYLKECDWLKSLRPQNRWKPDSSMLTCLEYAIKHINKDGDKKILSKLLEQLKKLKEEQL